MNTISIALAAYNGQKFLKAQLESLAEQTVPARELVVVDDASSDGTLRILSEFAKKAPFSVRVLANRKQLGYRTSFVKGADHCSSDLIAFCDQDDVWAPKKLETMVRLFGDREVLLACHNSTLIDENGSVLGTIFKNRGAVFPPLSKPPWIVIPGHAQVMRRSLLRFDSLHASSIDPYCPGELMPHDQWYLFWASVLGKIVYVPDCLAQYRQHADNASGWPHIGFFAYVSDHLSNAASYVRGESLGAKNRLDLLQACRELMPADEIARIDAALAYSKRLCARSDLRLAVYRGETLTDRARALFDLIGRGAYIGKTSETLGLPALLLDAAVGATVGDKKSSACH
jgi:rhamnosyltransferase